jgi:hypothetical protein
MQRVELLSAQMRWAMCERCIEIESKIERYRRLVRQIADPLTNEQAVQLIADLEAEKDTLHPQQV